MMRRLNTLNRRRRGLRNVTRPTLESMEVRQLLTVFTVTSQYDLPDDPNDGFLTLREAIQLSNANVSTTPDTIRFNIATSQPVQVGSAAAAALPTAPRSLTIASDNFIYFTTFDNRIGRSNLTGTINQFFNVPGLPADAELNEIRAVGDQVFFSVAGSGQPLGRIANLAAPAPTLVNLGPAALGGSVTLDIDPQRGLLWLARGDQVLRVSDLAAPGPGNTTVINLPPGTLGDPNLNIDPVVGFPGANIQDVAVGEDGRLWFTDAGTDFNSEGSFNRLGWINPNGTVVEPDLIINLDNPDAGLFLRPGQITRGPAGFPPTMWFTLFSSDQGAQIGRVQTISAAVTRQNVRVPSDPAGANLTLNDLIIGPDSNLYVTVGGNVPSIRRIGTGFDTDPVNPVPAGQVTSFAIFTQEFNLQHVATGRTNPFGIVRAPANFTFENQFLFFAEPVTRRIGRFESPSVRENRFVLGQNAPLPAITDPLYIDGYANYVPSPGAVAGPVFARLNTDPVFFNAVIPIVVSGSARFQPFVTAAAQREIGFDIRSSNVLIQGLEIREFGRVGVEVASAGVQGVALQGNRIILNGLNPAIPGTFKAGVRVVGSNNFVGVSSQQLPGTQLSVIQKRSEIGDNFRGVLIGDDNAATSSASGNRVLNNWIRDNNAEGVLIIGSNNSVGDRASGTSNLIVRNSTGVLIRSELTANPAPSRSNEVVNNVIGLDLTTGGSLIAGNRNSGVEILNSTQNLLEGNTISGNDLFGVWIRQTSNQVPSTGNRLIRNRIGVDVTGNGLFLGNALDGVRIEAGFNTIGGLTEEEANVISANRRDGVAIAFSPTANVTGNLIQGNLIGTDGDGIIDLGNVGAGVRITGSSGNTLGGVAEGAGNTISGNEWGVYLSNSAANNLIQGNRIGTDLEALVDLGNSREGIVLDGAPNNTIGGTIATAANIISGNLAGVRILGPGSTGNRLQGNFIGTNPAGSTVMGNATQGVRIDGGASNNTVGGTTNGAGNTIAFNALEGIRVEGGASLGNTLARNVILRNGSPANSAPTQAINLVGGGNANQPAPTITSVEIQGSTLRIIGNVANPVGGTVRLEFFANDPAIPGSVQAQTFLGSAIVNPGPFDLTLAAAVPQGRLITATATSLAAPTNTSALSAPATVQFAPAPIIVTTTADLVDPNDGQTSLREAILLANARPGPDTILFAIPGAGPHTILPTSPLPAITDAVFIDGFSQSGAVPNTSTVALLNANLQIVISGGLAGPGANGLVINSSNTFIRGLVINAFSGDGVVIAGENANGNVIAGNYIGTDVSGAVISGQSNGGAGVRVTTSNNVIGGLTPDARNFIANSAIGVVIEGANGVGNRIQGNTIRTNQGDGVRVTSPNNVIGAIQPEGGNVIAGNSRGVVISGDGRNVEVVNNLIGAVLNEAGGLVIPGNAAVGVEIDNARNNAIGRPGAGNTISGNGLGVRISGPQARDNVLASNRIGTTPDGALSGIFTRNASDGVVIQNQATGNVVGPGNTISGNVGAGVRITGVGTEFNQVVGNRIGTDLAGTIDLGNTAEGVIVALGASFNTIGGVQAGLGNLISGNQRGVVIANPGSTSNLVQGNTIGLSAGGTDLGNALEGLVIDNAPGNTVGGTTAAAANIIAGNDLGIRISGGSATNNQVLGNRVGVNAANTLIANVLEGIRIDSGAASNTIGGLAAGAGNTIGGNDFGIRIDNANGNALLGNFIGVDATGTISLPNNFDGVQIVNASNNRVGGPETTAGNLIAFNREYGVNVVSGLGNLILGNRIFSNFPTALLRPIPVLNPGIRLGSGANNAQPAPQLIDALTTPTSTTIRGVLNATPGTYTVEFFSNDPTDNPLQGRRLVGRQEVVVGPDGSEVFTATFVNRVPPGLLITATATSSTGNTSEFSNQVVPVLDRPAGPFLVVNTTADVVDPNDGVLSLREAILISNTTAADETIIFNIPGVGQQVITLTSPLPEITDTVIFRGFTQPGSSPNTLIDGNNNAVYNVVIDGAGLPAGTDGFVFTDAGQSAANSIVEGLLFRNFPGSAIKVVASDANPLDVSDVIIQGNAFINNARAPLNPANPQAAIFLASPFNQVGGVRPEQSNFLQNNQIGVRIADLNPPPLFNTIVGNLFDGNVDQGLLIEDSNNLVGGASPSAANTFIRNRIGIEIRDGVSPARGNVVQGNYIGTNLLGNANLGNIEAGVIIRSVNNTIGGLAEGEGNSIASNGIGVVLANLQAQGNLVAGNRIGFHQIDETTFFPLGNTEAGVSITGPNNQLIANRIASNEGQGLRISGTAASGNLVRSNQIGLILGDNSNLAVPGNVGEGILIEGGATANRIDLNQITANLHGVRITGPNSVNNRITGNVIGLNLDGLDSLVTPQGIVLFGNRQDGVLIESPNNFVGSALVGQGVIGQGNTISGNRRHGVHLTGVAASGNVLAGNRIGSDPEGLIDRGNVSDGVRIANGAANNVVGGPNGQGNLIGGNANGVQLVTAGANNRLESNLIGFNSIGLAELPNSSNGVVITNTPGTLLINNTIALNERGVRIEGALSTGNQLQGNRIGTSPDGTRALPNINEAVRITAGASNNTIGGATPAQGNLIAFNRSAGVVVDGPATLGNRILTNLIRDNQGGTGLLPAIDLLNGGNASQAAPVLQSIEVLNNATTIRFNFPGPAPAVPFTVQVFQSAPGDLQAGVPQARAFLGQRTFGAGDPLEVVLGGSLSPGTVVTATVTDANGNTSELSNALAVPQIGGTTLVVNTTDDPEDAQINFNDNIMSLREAILIANANPDRNQIVFAIPGTGVQTIRVTRQLPVVTQPVEILGFTQPGSSLNTIDNGFNSVLQVVISGSNLVSTTNPDGTPVNGLVLTSDNSYVIGLVINQFPGDGILISDEAGQGRNNLIRGNIIGADETGTNLLGNGGAGVRILAPNNSLGGNVANAKNLILGNTVGVAVGYRVTPSGQMIAVPSATGNLIKGNFVVSNREDGVLIRSSNNALGGADANEGNVIAGNGFLSNRVWRDSANRELRGFSGVRVTGIDDNGAPLVDRNGQPVNVAGNLILSNLIGTTTRDDSVARFRLGNARDGIRIEDAAGTRVGGPSENQRNIVADSGRGARDATGASGAFDPRTAGIYILGERARNTVVQSNFVGFDLQGNILVILPNRNGIRVESAQNTIGGATTEQGNTVSFNFENGILLSGAGANTNVIQGNFIGINNLGITPASNTLSGILLDNAPNNLIGGAGPARNVISTNNWGISLVGAGSFGNRLVGNWIGLANDGTTDLGNAQDGVRIIDAPRNTIGGLNPDDANVIAGNNVGVRISGSSATGNLVRGNLIGVGADRTTNVANNRDGVRIENNARENTIGGLDPAAANIIANNLANGVAVDGPGSIFNAILSNSIFNNAALGIDLTNGGNFEPNFARVILEPFFLDANGVTITGRLEGQPNASFLVQFFADPAPTAAQAQGRRLIGSTVVNTDASGRASFQVVTSEPIAASEFLTATASDSIGSDLRNTSEFSNPVRSSNQQTQPGVFVVNTVLDIVDPNDDLLSLREAILLANANPGLDLIRFNIPGDGVQVIRPLSPLPAITDSVTIDGFSQPGSVPPVAGDDPSRLTATLRVVVSGGLAGAGVDGLVVNAPNTTIRGLVINQFSGNGVVIRGATSVGNVLEGNFIGTDATGTVFLGQGNGLAGVRIESSNNLVGGLTTSSRNLIAGNLRGVEIAAGAAGNQVRGNVIRNNTRNFNQGGQGVLIQGTNNTVASNVIAANRQGVVVQGFQARGNDVVNNTIGAVLREDSSAVLATGNSGEGVLIDNSPDNRVGPGNTISGNGFGVAVRGPQATGNLIRGNRIGTNADGTLANVFTRNLFDGVRIEPDAAGSPRNTIVDGNVVSGNGRNGVVITANDRNGVRVAGNGPSGNILRNNLIGVGSQGTLDLGNVQSGVVIEDLTGGAVTGTRANVIGPNNTISGNNIGILLNGAGVRDNRVIGNRIGVTADGQNDLGNSLDGVRIIDAINNTIGGNSPTDGNVIGGNNRGVVVIASNVLLPLGNAISANFIGTDSSRTLNLGNKADGVRIENASGNVIGGFDPNQGNIIRFNNGLGVQGQQVVITTGFGNAILSNSIVADGGPGIDLGNDGPTPNDPAPDSDVGPNNLQNKPELLSLTVANGVTTVRGRLISAPQVSFLLQFFRNSDTTPFGQGEELIIPNEAALDITNVRRFVVTTNANGVAEFTVTFNRVIALGENITATATALQNSPTTAINDTSEFSDPISDRVGDFEFAVTNAVVSESAGVARVVVRRNASGGLASVVVSTVPPGLIPPGSAVPPGTAIPNIDFIPTSREIVFQPGQTEAVFEFPILNNNRIDGDRTVVVALSNPQPQGQAGLGNNSAATVLIQDDDAVAAQFRIRDIVVREDQNEALVLVELVGNDGQLKPAPSPVSVRFRTEDLTGVAFVDYLPVDVVLNFPTGVATQVVRVPILRTPNDTADKTVRLVLSNPTNGATLGRSEAVLTILNTSGPTIIGIDAVVGDFGRGRNRHQAITHLEVFFNTDMDRASVEDLNNYSYSVQGPGRDGRFNTVDDELGFFSEAVYNPVTQSVRLRLIRPLATNVFFQVTINQIVLNPASVGGIRDVNGNLLDPDGDGVAGGRFQSLIAVGNNLTYLDGDSDRVNLRITNNGLIQVTRDVNGEGIDLRVVRGNRRATLSGAINLITRPGRRPRPIPTPGNSVTTFQTGRGLERVRNTLSPVRFRFQEILPASIRATSALTAEMIRPAHDSTPRIASPSPFRRR